MDPFVHLRVASGYSLQHGASHPHVLVERAAEQEMDTLALTDRDGTYGAVKFAQACRVVGIRPVLGVDLAYQPVLAGAPRSASRSRTPTRGGELRDPVGAGLPRVTLLASAGGPGGGRAGWAAICRLVSAVHLAGERGQPVATLDLLAPWLAAGDVTVLLGPGSEVGAAISRRRDDLAHAALAAWREVVPPGHLHVELVSHRLGRPGPGATGDWGPGSSPHAARMAGLAHREGIGTVLTNAVRYADRRDAPTIDVLDASRRLVALDRAAPRPGERRGVPQVRQADARGGRGGLPDGRPGGPRTGCSPAPAPSPSPAPSTRAPTSASARCTSPTWTSPRSRPTACCAPAARGRSATATARPRASASGSVSTTSSSWSAASATRRTSSPSPTSPT